MGCQLALHAADAPHDRDQDEPQERVETSLPLVWFESLQEGPEADLAEVVEQLVEEGDFVERVHAIHRSRLVEFLGDLAVVPGRGPPTSDLGQPCPEGLAVSRAARHLCGPPDAAGAVRSDDDGAGQIHAPV